MATGEGASYDDLGRVTRVTADLNRDGIADPDEPATQTFYDSLGRKQYEIDQASQQTDYATTCSSTLKTPTANHVWLRGLRPTHLPAILGQPLARSLANEEAVGVRLRSPGAGGVSLVWETARKKVNAG